MDLDRNDCWFYKNQRIPQKYLIFFNLRFRIINLTDIKKSSISRRDFMKGLATGALSVAIVPSWAGEQDLTPKRTAVTAKSAQI